MRCVSVRVLPVPGPAEMTMTSRCVGAGDGLPLSLVEAAEEGGERHREPCDPARGRRGLQAGVEIEERRLGSVRSGGNVRGTAEGIAFGRLFDHGRRLLRNPRTGRGRVDRRGRLVEVHEQAGLAGWGGRQGTGGEQADDAVFPIIAGLRVDLPAAHAADALGETLAAGAGDVLQIGLAQDEQLRPEAVEQLLHLLLDPAGSRTDAERFADHLGERDQAVVPARAAE